MKVAEEREDKWIAHGATRTVIGAEKVVVSFISVSIQNTEQIALWTVEHV